jgi:citrate synthase
MSDKELGEVTKRDEKHSTRPITRIWQEVPAPDDPYNPTQALCHGYDLFALVKNVSFIEVLYLLFRGELPSASQAELLEKWWIASINPGPRHPATRAAMNAAVGKTNAVHFLPIALSVLGGGHLGAEEVRQAMRFMRKHLEDDPQSVAEELLQSPRPPAGDWHIAPGFGTRFGGLDRIANQTAALLAELSGAGPAARWASRFVQVLTPNELGWLDPGVAAAVLLDLGFDEYAAMGLFQLSRAPGVLAHGIEMVGQPTTALPFPDDDHYLIEE